jgi:hypothetical protein
MIEWKTNKETEKMKEDIHEKQKTEKKEKRKTEELNGEKQMRVGKKEMK